MTEHTARAYIARLFWILAALTAGAIISLALVGGTLAIWWALAIVTLLALTVLAIALTAHAKIFTLESQNLELAQSLRSLREDLSASGVRR